MRETTNKAEGFVAPAGSGTVLHAFGNAMTVLMDGEATGNKLAVLLDVTPPGGGPGPHVHSEDDELFLLLEGKMSYYIDGKWIELSPGSAVFAPRGVVHAYRNVGAEPAKQWVISTPASFERFFALCQDEFAKPGGPDMAIIGKLSADFGMAVVDEVKS